MGDVILGMPGRWAASNYEVADHYTTKIGGVPDWCFPVRNMKQHLLKCNGCGSNLSLIAQVYAPIAGKILAIDERVIYVFSCITPTCDSIIWRAVRVQKIPLVAESDPVPNNKRQDNMWSFDDDESDNDGSDDDIDLEELSKALSEAANALSAGKEQNSRKPILKNQPTNSYGSKEQVMPCFYIYSEGEKLPKNDASKSSKDHSLLTKEYEKIAEDDSDGEKYEMESYEYDRARDADRTYLKFKKRLDAYPEQCFRYSYGGTPLLSSGDAGDPGSCCLCGEPRHYEMQLMPPLIYFLQEAADEQQRISLEKFDWMTLLIYTCSQSCAVQTQSHEGWIVAEEAVILQNEGEASFKRKE